jgi:hypothetical protein
VGTSTLIFSYPTTKSLKAWKNLSEDMSHNRNKVKLDIISLTIVIACLERCSKKDYRRDIDDVFADAVKHQIVFPHDSFDTTWEKDLSGMR